MKKYDNIITDDTQFISDIKAIVYTAKQKAYKAADIYQVVSNWLVGRRIVEQEQYGRERAEYGKRVIDCIRGVNGRIWQRIQPYTNKEFQEILPAVQRFGYSASNAC